MSYSSVSEALASDDVLGDALGAAPVALSVVALDGTCLFVNAQWCAMTGLAADEALGAGWLGAFDPNDVRSLRDSWLALIASEGRMAIELRIVGRSRPGVRSRARARATRGASAAAVIAYDDTSDLQGSLAPEEAQAQLRESERRFRAIANYTADWETWFGPDGRPAWINPAVELVTGYPVSECMQRDDYPFFLAPDADRGVVETILTEGGAGRSGRGVEFRIQRRDGGAAHMSASWAPMFDDDGSSLGFRLSIRDVTERVRMESELLATRSHIRTLLDSAHMIAVILDRKGIVTYCNDYLLGITGWGRDELMGRDWFSVMVPAAERDAVRSVFETATAAGLIPPHHENGIVTRSGAVRVVFWDNTVLRGGDGAIEGIASLGIDRTDSRRLEAGLRQTQKMEAIGTLAGGVAHEFNNIITAIAGYADLALASTEEGTSVHSDLQRIMESASRAAAVAQSLLAFSRKQPTKLEAVDLNELVTSFLSFIRRLLRADVSMNVDLCRTALPVRVDATQMQQVLVNLVTNAVDAMPGGGKLTIRTSEPVEPAILAQCRERSNSPAWAALTVADTGLGMSQEVLARVFEPFFTTKPMSNRSGLGLAVAHGIVTKLNGVILAESEPGHGSTFRLCLPLLAAATAPVLSSPPRTATSSPTPGETILLAEDDPDVRRMTARALRREGYTVVEAEDGAVAVDEFAKNRASIRVVILDGVMPNLNGGEVYVRIHAIEPAVKAIFTSGYAEDIYLKDGIALLDGPFLQKPYSPKQLVALVRDILGRGA